MADIFIALPLHAISIAGSPKKKYLPSLSLVIEIWEKGNISTVRFESEKLAEKEPPLTDSQQRIRYGD